MAIWDRFIHLIGLGSNIGRRRSLEAALADARYCLGEKMYAAGIDDGRLAAQIAVADERIRQAGAVGNSTAQLRAERRNLMLQLADAALDEDAPLPGADIEYQKARAAQAALQALSGPANVKAITFAERCEPVGVRP